MSLSPPRPHPAPLNALRAFEAAYRLGGFAAAAEELSVSPGAVASHVKSLEALIGAPLFHRRAHGVVPTALADSVGGDFAAAFDQLGAAMARLRRAAAPREIRIAALPAIAQLWLSPRLPALRAAAPGMAISVAALERPPDLKREAFDIAIFFEAAPGAAAVVPGPRNIATAVCAPSFAAGLKTESDLESAVRLSDAVWRDDWRRWAPGLGAPEGPVFSLYALAVEEVSNGAGVMIGRLPLVERRLADGSLIAPFPRTVDFGGGMALSLAVAEGEAALVASRLLEPGA